MYNYFSMLLNFIKLKLALNKIIFLLRYRFSTHQLARLKLYNSYTPLWTSPSFFHRPLLRTHSRINRSPRNESPMTDEKKKKTKKEEE